MTKMIIRLSFVGLITIIFSFYLNDISFAKGRGGGGHRSSRSSIYKSSGSGYKSIKVKSYYRKDGAFVPSYSRSAPTFKSKSYAPSKSYKNYTSSSALGVKRDSDGRIERSSAAKNEFLKSKGYDKVPPGYEVDHIVPLYKGGADEPSNMQLFPKDLHKQKTKMDLNK